MARPGAALLLAGAWGIAAPAAAVASQADLQEAVVEVAVGRLVQRTVRALERDGEILLPVLDVLELVEVEAAADTAGRVAGVRYPEGIPFLFDPRAGAVRVAGRDVPVAPGAVLERDGVAYAALEVWEHVLGVNLRMDWTELRVEITNPESLPVARRLARESARAARLEVERRARLRAEREFGLRRPVWQGAVLDWSVFVPNGRSLDGTRYRLGLGSNVGGGALDVELEDGPGAARVRASWLGVWPESRWLRQAGLGDLVGTGPRRSPVRGALLTNAPFLRPAAFGFDELTGRLAPGWEVELYRDGELVDYVRTDEEGFFRLRLPVQYGPNPVELRAYGPGGREESWARALRVTAERLPAGTFEYGLSGGRCEGRPCRTLGNLDLRYGVSESWTLQAGVDAVERDTLPDLVHPYAGVFATLLERVVLRLEAMGRGFARADAAYEPSPDLRVAFGWTGFDRDVTAPVFTPAGARAEWRASAFWRPVPARRAWFLEAGARRSESATGTFSALRVGGSAQWGNVRAVGGWRRDWTEGAGFAVRRSVLELGASGTVRWRGAPAFDRWFLRGATQWSDRGAEFWEAFASRPLGRATRVEARAAWQRGTGGLLFALGVATAWPAARSFTQVTRTPGTPLRDATFSNLTEGSVMWNAPSRRLEFGPGRALRRGGLAGVVFLDANANGRYDPDEEPLPGVRLRVGPFTVETDDAGRFQVWDLVPFVTEPVTIDSLSLASPLWVPAFGLATVVVTPNGYARVDVPVVEGAEVSGRVVWRDVAGARPLAGVRVELEHVRTGRRTSAVTFSDGEFYVLGLPPGEYRVRVPEDVAAALGARRPPDVRLAVEPGARPAPVVLELGPP